MNFLPGEKPFASLPSSSAGWNTMPFFPARSSITPSSYSPNSSVFKVQKALIEAKDLLLINLSCGETIYTFTPYQLNLDTKILHMSMPIITQTDTKGTYPLTRSLYLKNAIKTIEYCATYNFLDRSLAHAQGCLDGSRSWILKEAVVSKGDLTIDWIQVSAAFQLHDKMFHFRPWNCKYSFIPRKLVNAHYTVYKTDDRH